MQQHLKIIEDKKNLGKIKNIDFIYLINLDRRPERWAESQEKLAPFRLCPHRVSAIDGWSLSEECVLELGLTFAEGMGSGEDKYFKSVLYPGSKTSVVLDASCLGKSCYNVRMTLGGIGCMLSHLSVLQDALESGYETIWVLEDDFLLKNDPHLLGEKIEQIEQEWDILYTDPNDSFQQMHAVTIWRPDQPSFDYGRFEQKAVSEQVLKIGGRYQTCSMLIRRAGMKKILDHAKKGFYLPYDLDLAFVAGIRLYALKESVVEGPGALLDSDTDLLTRKPFVSCKLSGSIGEMLFQIAATLALSWDHDAAPYFPELYQTKIDPLYRSQLFYRLDPFLPSYRKPHYYYERGDEERLPFTGNQVLVGQFRSPRHFHRHRDALLACFAPTSAMEQRLAQRLFDADKTAAMFFTKEDLVSLCQAHSQLPSDTRYLLIAEEQERQILQELLVSVAFLPDTPESFFLLTRMRITIVGASATSWWVGYFNQHPRKQVLPEWSLL